MKARHPLPPRDLYADDLDADGKFTQYKELFQKMSATRLQAADMSPAEVKRSDLDLDLDSETKRNEVDSEVPLPLVAGAAPSATDAVAKPFFLILKNNPRPPLAIQTATRSLMTT